MKLSIRRQSTMSRPTKNAKMNTRGIAFDPFNRTAVGVAWGNEFPWVRCHGPGVVACSGQCKFRITDAISMFIRASHIMYGFQGINHLESHRIGCININKINK